MDSAYPNETTAPDASHRGKIVEPIDPNDILAPGGFGDAHWIPATEALQYTIRFENDAELATAPVRELTVIQELDEDLDFRTFRLTSFGFGEHVFTVPANTAFYQTRLDLTKEIGLYVDVSAGIDVITGKVTYRFTAIDPQTGRLPDDPLVGFLPVNDENGIGEGFISYTVKALADAVTGTEITAEADIFFDYNDAIPTPTVFNTLDAQAPTSEITNISEGEDNTVIITVESADTDDGSGVAYYDLYVSVNGGAYEKAQSEILSTTVSYTVEEGNHYRFFTAATDNAGNKEAPKQTADAEYDAGYNPSAPLMPVVDVNVMSSGTAYATVEAQSGTTVIYTTDGSDPTLENALVYTEGVLLAPGTTFKAVAVSDGIYGEIASYYSDIALANGEVVLETETHNVVGLGENTSAKELLNLFNGGDGDAQLYSKDSAELSADDQIGTGSVLTYNDSEYYVVILGDLNGDGIIDIFDTLMMVDYVNGEDELSDLEFAAGSVVGDDGVDVTDVMAIVDYLNGDAVSVSVK